jgi:hypothetical protein
VKNSSSQNMIVYGKNWKATPLFMVPNLFHKVRFINFIIPETKRLVL